MIQVTAIINYISRLRIRFNKPLDMENKAKQKKLFTICSGSFLGAIKPKISKTRERMSKEIIRNRSKLVMRLNGN